MFKKLYFKKAGMFLCPKSDVSGSTMFLCSEHKITVANNLTYNQIIMHVVYFKHGAN